MAGYTPGAAHSTGSQAPPPFHVLPALSPAGSRARFAKPGRLDSGFRQGFLRKSCTGVAYKGDCENQNEGYKFAAYRLLTANTRICVKRPCFCMLQNAARFSKQRLIILYYYTTEITRNLAHGQGEIERMRTGGKQARRFTACTKALDCRRSDGRRTI